MRRENMIQQFNGEPDPLSSGAAAEEVGYDEVQYDIVRGKLSVVVPADVSDDSIWDSPRVCHLEVETEEGQIFQLEINMDGTGSVL